VRRAYGLRTRPKPKDILRIGERWAPFSSTASWYLWRVLELPAWDTATRTRKKSATTKKRGTRKGATKKRTAASRKKRSTAKKRAAK